MVLTLSLGILILISTLFFPVSNSLCACDTGGRSCSKESMKNPVEDDEKCSETPAPADTGGSSMAVVLYDENIISPFHKSSRKFTFGDITVEMAQDWQKTGIAAVVWDAAVVLGEYIERHRHLVVKKRVLELGAGTGLVGIVASLVGGEVTITDRAMALDILQQNVDLNMAFPCGSRPLVRELTWGQGLAAFNTYDVVVGADIVYIESTFPDLLQTLHHVSSSATHVLLASKLRYDRDHRFYGLLRETFSVEEVYYDQHRDIHIYDCRKQ